MFSKKINSFRKLHIESLENRELLSVSPPVVPAGMSASVHETKDYSVTVSLGNNQYAYIAGLSYNDAQYALSHQGNLDFLSKINPYDAEKSLSNPNDDSLCWAATAANMLAYTGWGQGYQTEDDVFKAFQDNFADGGGHILQGLDWFITGNYNQGQSATLEGNGGGYWNNYVSVISAAAGAEWGNYADGHYVMDESGINSVLAHLQGGDAVGVYVDYGDSAHTVTCWGVIYTTDADGNIASYDGLLVSDSDDGQTADATSAANELQKLYFDTTGGSYAVQWTAENNGYSAVGVLGGFTWLNNYHNVNIASLNGSAGSGCEIAMVNPAAPQVAGLSGWDTWNGVKNTVGGMVEQLQQAANAVKQKYDAHLLSEQNRDKLYWKLAEMGEGIALLSYMGQQVTIYGEKLENNSVSGVLGGLSLLMCWNPIGWIATGANVLYTVGDAVSDANLNKNMTEYTPWLDGQLKGIYNDCGLTSRVQSMVNENGSAELGDIVLSIGSDVWDLVDTAFDITPKIVSKIATAFAVKGIVDDINEGRDNWKQVNYWGDFYDAQAKNLNAAFTKVSQCLSFPNSFDSYFNSIPKFTVLNDIATAVRNQEDVKWLNNFLAVSDHSNLTASIAQWSNGRLTSLNLFNKGLTGTLDVSALTALTSLKCDWNQLTALDVSNCTALTYLSCSYNNQLTALDVSNCTALPYLSCSYNNQLTALDVSGCTALTYLECPYNNQLTALDVSGCTALTTLYCFNNNLTSLNVSGCTALTTLLCDSNKLKLLCLPKAASSFSSISYYNNPSIEVFVGIPNAGDLAWRNNFLDDHPNLTRDIATWTNGRITSLNVYNKGLTGTLDVSALTALTSLYCYSNQLKLLCLPKAASSFSNISYYNNPGIAVVVGLPAADTLADLAWLDDFLDKHPNLTRDIATWTNGRITSLGLSNRGLTTLDVSTLTALTSLSCSSNQLTSLDVSNCKELTYLYCYSDQLKLLCLPKAESSFSSISYSNNHSIAVVVGSPTADTLADLAWLDNFLAAHTNLTGDIARWTNGRITSLGLSNRGLTTLDVSTLTALTSLSCESNGMKLLYLPKAERSSFYWLSYSYNNPGIAVVTGGIPDAGDAVWLKIFLDTHPNLTGSIYVECTNGQITSLSLNNCGLTGTLDVSALTALTSLNCSSNQLKLLYLPKAVSSFRSISYSNNPGIAVVTGGIPDAGDAVWLKIFLDTHPNLTGSIYVECTNGQITSLSLNNCGLTGTLDVSALTALTTLNCYSNQLTALDVSKNTALTYLSCYSNKLTSLDVSKNTALTSLYCYSNQLKLLCLPKAASSFSSISYDNNSNIVVFVGSPTADTIADLDWLVDFLDKHRDLYSSVATWTNGRITSLGLYNKGLTTLDVSTLTALTSLSCYSNKLTSLDVSKNTALTSLSCYSNKLTSLDVSKNTALTSLSCDSNQLTALDVSKNTALTTLYCYSNALTSLDVSALTALTSLYCSDNKLTALDVSKNTALTSLDCSYNQLTALDVSKNTALTRLECNSNQLTALDVSKNTALTSLSCYSNKLTSLDVSKNTALTSLSCYSNKLIILCLPKAASSFRSISYDNNSNIVVFVGSPTADTLADLDWLVDFLDKHPNLTRGIATWTNGRITSLNLYNEGLTGALDVSALTALTSLDCSSNQLTALDVSKNTALTSLYCSDNQLTALDVSKNTALTSLSCDSNQLTALDVSKNTALTYLSCGGNQLTALDVSKNTALTSLSCDSNQLTALDVSKNTALTYLSCGGNQLTALDVSKNTALTTLNCYYNQLTALDVSKNTALTSLSCDSNQLTALDVSKNTALTYLYCYSNQLTALDVSKNTALTSLSCDNNGMKLLYLPKSFSSDFYSSGNYGIDVVVGSPAADTIKDIAWLNTFIASQSNLTGSIGVTWTNGRITSLNLSSKKLVGTLDVSALTALTYLDCQNNQLEGLDVSKNTALTTLFCNNNQLTALDVSKNTALTSLGCDSNQLTALDVSKNTALTRLSCSYNQLTALDVSKNTALTSLDCSSNQLTALDVSKNTALDTLYCRSNQLTALDVSKNTALTYLYCDNNGMKYLYLPEGFSRTLSSTGNPGIAVVTGGIPDAGDAVWLKIFLDTHPNLTGSIYVECTNGQITSLSLNNCGLTGTLDVSALTALTSLDCSYNKLTALDVSKNTALTSLYCKSNGMIILWLPKAESSFYWIHYYNNPGIVVVVGSPTADTLADLAWLDDFLAAHPDLTGSIATWTNGRITSLNVYNNVYNKGLTGTLDVSALTALTSLSCSSNQLTALDVSKNTALTRLYCYNNQLTALDVSKNTALTYLYCDNNGMKYLYLPKAVNSISYSNNPGIAVVTGGIPDAGDAVWLKIFLDTHPNLTGSIYVECTNGQITSLSLNNCGLTGTLDVSALTALTRLSCGANQLTSLDVSKNTALIELDCSSNQLTALDVSNCTALTFLACGANQLASLDVNKNTALTYLSCDNNGMKYLYLPKAESSFSRISYYNPGIRVVIGSPKTDLVVTGNATVGKKDGAAATSSITAAFAVEDFNRIEAKNSKGKVITTATSYIIKAYAWDAKKGDFSTKAAKTFTVKSTAANTVDGVLTYTPAGLKANTLYQITIQVKADAKTIYVDGIKTEGNTAGEIKTLGEVRTWAVVPNASLKASTLTENSVNVKVSNWGTSGGLWTQAVAAGTKSAKVLTPIETDKATATVTKNISAVDTLLVTYKKNGDKQTITLTWDGESWSSSDGVSFNTDTGIITIRDLSPSVKYTVQVQFSRSGEAVAVKATSVSVSTTARKFSAPVISHFQSTADTQVSFNLSQDVNGRAATQYKVEFLTITNGKTKVAKTLTVDITKPSDAWSFDGDSVTAYITDLKAGTDYQVRVKALAAKKTAAYNYANIASDISETIVTA